MDELSKEAKAFLALAKREQEPTPDNMERVHRRVLGAAAATGTAALTAKASASSKASGAAYAALSSMAAKIGAGAIALSLVGAGVWAARREPGDEQRRAAAATPHAYESSLARPRARFDQRTEVVEVARKPDDTLPDELALLQRADDALSAGDVERGLALLSQHRRQFAAPHLVEERDALELLARCTIDPAATRAQAKRFVLERPEAILNLRLRQACGLERP